MDLSAALDNDEFKDLTEAECVTALAEVVEVSRDSTSYTWSSLNLKLLEDGVDLATVSTWDQGVGSMTGGSMLKEMLGATGIDFTLEPVRMMLKGAIAASDKKAVIALLNALLNVGIKTGPRWKKYDIQTEPTEADIKAARVKRQNEKDASGLLNECIQPMISESASIADIKTAVAAWGE